jgi:spermidine synthase
MSRHGIPRIQAVELVAEQVAAARIYQQENRGVLDYPGLRIAIEDGRNYLLRSDERFDIITADATHPVNTSSWALFTSEFYALVRQRLADDGVFVQWLPFHDLSSQDYRDIVKTFQSVFPHTSLWYTGGTHSFLVATPQPLTRAQVAALDTRIQAAGVADDLGDAQKLAADMLMGEEAVARYVASARIVTDDRAFFIPAKDSDAILAGWEPYVQLGQAQP